ncbi:uncharacterized protein LOC120558883 [Perca fluviatilis]|uniref:uncharacterized protein LOC120558883 n=1 Tax=Perca fluviatilis TaxID=8168 RepID=UPI001965B612|nr:uncharacterized protein LOC120558883 [Perca fluviatilis]
MKTLTSLLDLINMKTLVAILLFSKTTLGEHRLTCPQTIEAAEGDDVIIQCGLDPPVDLSFYTFDVARLDLSSYGDVHCYRRGTDHLDDQMDRYRDRTTLHHEDLIRGIVTLKISSVTLSDSGPYKVYVPDLTAPSVINITVVPKGQVSETKRNDPTTTRPPATSPGSAKEESDWKTVVPIVCGVVGVLLLLLVKRGVIQSCIERLRGRKEQEPETAGNGCEMKNLNMEAAKGDEDLERAAGNGNVLL